MAWYQSIFFSIEKKLYQMSFKFGTNQSPGSTNRLYYFLTLTVIRYDSYIGTIGNSLRILDLSENEIDLFFGTTADKSYHDMVIQNGKTSPIMNSTSSQSKGGGSSHMVALTCHYGGAIVAH